MKKRRLMSKRQKKRFKEAFGELKKGWKKIVNTSRNLEKNRMWEELR